MWWVGYSDHRRAFGSSGLQFNERILSTTCILHKVTTQMWNPCWIQDRTVNHIVSHAEFNPRNLGNTIALLFVENDFELADHIDTICLPAYQVLSWSSCTTSIWSSPLSPSWSIGELWAEQGLLCEGLGQGCLWQRGRVSGSLSKSLALTRNDSSNKTLLWWSKSLHLILTGGAERGLPSHGERCPVPWLAESHKARQKASCNQLEPIGKASNFL